MPNKTHWLAVVFLGAGALALGNSPAIRPSAAEPDPALLAYRLAVGAVARDGLPPSAAISNSFAYQGGAVLISVANATAGTVRAFGRSYPLSATGESLSGYVGFGTEDPPGAAQITVSVTDLTGNAVTYSRSILVKKTQWTVDRIELPPSVGGILDDPNVSIREQNRLNALYSGVTPRNWRDTWTSPVDTTIPISGYFGEQRSFNGGPVAGHHGGTDFGASAGTPIRATNDGVIVLAETLAVRGNMVIIDHGGGVFSGYGHMEAMQVTVGDVVAQGDVIGRVGTTGLSTGAHLHWELSVAGVLVDGLRWLDGTQGF
jgi:hypothetical protein